jgi:hypothetical protein
MTHLRQRTWVNIIESPSRRDLAEGRSEGKMLIAALNLIGLPYEYSLVSTYSEFMEALGRKLALGIQKYGSLPVLHFSMHGNERGVVLTDRRFLPWNDLNWKLRLVNSRLRNTLIVCLSSCHGFQGAAMIRDDTVKGGIEDDAPFRLLVSNLRSVPWSDAAVAFSTFYHHLARGTQLLELVRIIRIASGNDEFFGLLVGASTSQVLVLGTEAVKRGIEVH